MIEDGDASFTDRHDRAVDVHETRFGFWRSHAFSSDLKARSQNNRCLSAFAIFLGSSIDGNKPKWMFIGAKSFWGVETYRHSDPIAESSGNISGSSPLQKRTAFKPATSPDATFSI